MLTTFSHKPFKVANARTILSEKSFFHCLTSKHEFSRTKRATPPRLPTTEDQKLGPRHLDRKFVITSGFDPSISCKKKTNSV